MNLCIIGFEFETITANQEFIILTTENPIYHSEDKQK